MQLHQYPQAINTVQFAILCQQQGVRKLKDALSSCDREIEGRVAFDESLKNEQQRKCRKAELQTDGDYQGLLNQVRDAELALAQLNIDLELLQNSFTVAKIEARSAIARAYAAFEEAV